VNKDEKRPDPFAEYERLSGNSGMGEGHQQKEPSWWRDKPADAAKATVNETLTVPPGVQAIAEKAAAFLAYENYTIMSPKGVERAAIPIIAEACREVKVAADKAWLDADKVLGEVNDELVKTKAKLAEALEMFVARGHLLDINHATIADLKAKLAEVERDGETASHNAKYYADMSLKLEDEVEKLRGVLEEIAETEMTEMDETSEYAISEEPVLGATAMCNIAKAALKPRAEPKKEEQDESK